MNLEIESAIDRLTDLGVHLEYAKDNLRIHYNLPMDEGTREKMASWLVMNKAKVLFAVEMREETQLKGWLLHIGETDEEIIDDVVGRFRTDSDARIYFLKRSAEATK